MQIRVFKKSVYILLSTTFFAQKPNNENKLPLKIKDTELAMCVFSFDSFEKVWNSCVRQPAQCLNTHCVSMFTYALRITQLSVIRFDSVADKQTAAWLL